MIRFLVIVIALLLPAVASAQQQNQGQDAVVLSRWNYDPLYADGWSARALYNDTTVIGPYGDDIGSIENIIFSGEGRVLGVVAEVGGFLDIGDTHLFIPWEEVRISADFNRITVPITEENAEDYTFAESSLWQGETGRIQQVGEVDTGPQVWKFSDVVTDYTYFDDGSGYGYIYDLIVTRGGDVRAIIVNADAAYGGGYRALPYRDYDVTSPYYELGYTRDDVNQLDRFDYNRVAGGASARNGWGAGIGAGTGSPNR